MPELPSLLSLPNDNRMWMLKWFGQVDPHDLELGPRFKAVFTPLNSNKYTNKDLLCNKFYLHDQSKICNLSLGILPFIHIGTIWQNGKVVDRPSFHEKIYTVDFNREKIQCISSNSIKSKTINNLGEEVRIYHIPMSHHPIWFKNQQKIHDECAITKCIVAPAFDHKCNQPIELIFPCMELARFYFTNSTQLTYKVFCCTMTSALEEICVPYAISSNEDKSIPYVRLRKVIPDEDALIVARMRYSQIANKEMRSIRDTLLKNLTNYKKGVFEALPPFDGKSKMKVRGKRITRKDSSEAFLVYSIEHCNAEFPFKKLLWGREYDARKAKTDKELPKIGYIGSYENAILNQEPDFNKKIKDDLESSIKSCVYNYVKRLNKFSCADIEIKKEEKIEQKTESSIEKYTEKNDIGEYLTVQRPESSSREGPSSVRTTIIEWRRDIGILPISLEKFKEILEEMESIDSNVSYKLDKRGNIRWSTRKIKCLLIARVCYLNSYFYFFELERHRSDKFSTAMIFNSDFTSISLELINIVIDDTVNHGGWIKDYHFRHLRKKVFKHTYNDFDKNRYANKFLASIKSLCNISLRK